jgi:hypothetical protein
MVRCWHAHFPYLSWRERAAIRRVARSFLSALESRFLLLTAQASRANVDQIEREPV